MARRRSSAKARMAYVRSFRKANPKRKRRYRRNPFPVGGLVVNPRRRSRRRSTGAVRVMVNRRRYRRNPAIMGFEVPSIRPALEVTAGYLGTGALENVLTTAPEGSTPIIPTTITGNQIGKYAVKIGCAIAVTYLSKLAKLNTSNVSAGAGAYVVIAAVKEFAPGWVPGLSAYTPLRAYTPGRLNGPRSIPMPQLAQPSGRFSRF